VNRYQWTVLFAAWLGWGFDCFDGLLFNYVAPNCVPALLGLTLGSAEAKHATLYWTGVMTAVLLVGWAAGGILFGRLADQWGRTRTLLATMLLYALGTAACAFAPNIWVLLLFRVVASLGIGGEWAAGAAMVAEVVPENRRVEAGALLYTSAPMGLFLATYVNLKVAGDYLRDAPERSWRYVFLFGLVPAAVAFLVRLFIKEPERWQRAQATQASPRLAELFGPSVRRSTLSGFLMAVTALIAWWGTNAFIPVVASGLGSSLAKAQGLARGEALSVIEHAKAQATTYFNLGGLIGTLLTIPLAKRLGRRVMFGVYFVGSAVALLGAFGLSWPEQTRLYFYFPIGLTTFGVFGSFTYYLPELFPTRLRGTGAGFCYNIGRLLAALGAFGVGAVAARGQDALATALQALAVVGIVPLAGVLAMPWVVETRGVQLAD
jgi:MFS family permease